MIGGGSAGASMIVVFILGLMFKLCSVKLSSTNQTRPSDILEEYASKKRKINCRLTLAIILFILITGFLSVYLIAFCRISDSSVEEDWIKSSLAGIVADLVGIELLIALYFGGLGSMWGSCGKCVSCFLFPVQAVREVKSFSWLTI